MPRNWKIAVAILVALTVFVILVAPSVDLPATALRALVYAMVFFFLLRLPSLKPAARLWRPVPVACATGPPLRTSSPPSNPPASLRC